MPPILRCAFDGKRKPPTDRNPVRTEDTMLNGAYLVDGDVIGEFMETVATLDRSTASIRLEVTGPWPPYSFAQDVIAI
jgi:hypothetical protein